MAYLERLATIRIEAHRVRSRAARLAAPTWSAAPPFLLLLFLVFQAILPSRAGADEFVMPSGGYLSAQSIGGEAGGITTFGLGTSPGDFVALLSGLPNSPSSLAAINAGFFAAGATTHFGMFTTFSGSGWAFSNGTDQASLVAFTDTDNASASAAASSSKPPQTPGPFTSTMPGPTWSTTMTTTC